MKYDIATFIINEEEKRKEQVLKQMWLRTTIEMDISIYPQPKYGEI